MNDLQLDPANQNAAGKTGEISATIFFILFSLPFAGFGVMAAVQGIKKIAAGGDVKDGMMQCLFGLVFFAVGLGLMAFAIWTRKKAKLRARYADKPWLVRADWAAGKIKSSTAAQSVVFLIMGLMFCGIGGVSSFFAIREVLTKHHYVALVGLIFPLAGIGLLIAFVNTIRSRRRFGNCYFELAQVPIPLGGVLDGMIQTGARWKPEHELHLNFSCIRRVTTNTGKNSSTTESVLWQGEKIYSAQADLPEPQPGCTGIPVHFQVPADQPQCFTRANVTVLWRLEAKTKMRGPDFHVVFEVPVFQVAGAAAAADDADPTAIFQASIEEVRRDENSKIKVGDGPNGREFYFPAARNLAGALFMTGFFLVWSGFLGFMIFQKQKHVPILFPIVFGLADVLVFLGCWNLWLKSSRVTIDSTTVRATNGYLIFSRTRRFSAGEVVRFQAVPGMTSGSKVFYNLKLVTQDSQDRSAAKPDATQPPGLKSALQQLGGNLAGATVASGIASETEANWLAQEMNRALGRRQ